MITFATPQGYAIPIKEFEKVQNKELKAIKYEGKHITDFGKLSAYYPEVTFKNVTRMNDDGTMDIVVDSSVATEIHTGFLPKRFYKALRVKKEKGLLGSKLDSLDIIQVSEKEIVNGFNSSLPIAEVEGILEAGIKKGVKYFG